MHLCHGKLLIQRTSQQFCHLKMDTHTCKSMQPLHRYNCLKNSTLASIYEVHWNCECINTHWFWKTFQSCLLKICRNNFTAGSCWSVKLPSRVWSYKSGNETFCNIFMLSTHKCGTSWKANFGVVRKPIPTFIITVHWRNFDIEWFSQRSTKLSKKRDFRLKGNFG